MSSILDFGKSYFVSALVGWVLDYGMKEVDSLDWEKTVKGIFPGSKYDSIAWNFIEPLIPKIKEGIHKYGNDPLPVIKIIEHLM